MSTEPLLEEIAVVGMSGRFPGARDIEVYWENLRAGRESIVEIPDAELLQAGVSAELLGDPNYVRARGMLDDVEMFDPDFFEILPREAANMDPQHRLVLEHAWAALEHAGCDPERFRGDIGIFAGAAQNSYLLSNIVRDRAFIQDFLAFRGPGQFQTSLGNDKDFLTSRVSYKLNLTGPGVTVQTSCSTSLAAICQATQSLLTYQCDLALAGGVAISFPLARGYHYQEGGMVSPDGHCRAFDARAQGTVFGNGLGLVVLRRLNDALAAGNTIYAVIKGAALNNDGAAKVSYTAPSVEGQARVITLAHQLAGISADSISYIEAHGTGTALGDPIEVAALTRAFRAQTERVGFCALGSVKTNIGHLDAAAGVAGLIKTVLALHHRELPPSLHFEQPNPGIDFASSPFAVNTAHRAWTVEGPRRAGVSSFGVGGTNAHVVLEEAPALAESAPVNRPQVLVLSAKTPAALERMTENLSVHLATRPQSNIADVAHTLQTGRRLFAHRRAFVAETDLKSATSAFEERRQRPIVFLFPGQGAQSPGMGRGLYATEPVFRAAYDVCAEAAAPYLGLDLRDFQHEGEPAAEWYETRVAQPALFAISYALAQLWISWGIIPTALAGHSVGEYVAATLAGIFSVETGMALVSQRARLVHDLPPGAMLAVRISEEELRGTLPAGLVIAAINAPKLCVVAGPEEAMAGFEAQLAVRKVAAKRLASSHAFHSPMVEPAVEPFRQLVEGVELRTPQIPIVSCTTGQWLTPEQATHATYWAKHLRQPVRFADVLGTLLTEGDALLLESGPGQALTTLARQHPSFSTKFAVAASLPSHENEPVAMASALARLWLAGVEIDWAAYRGEERRRLVALPTYPFERRRCWVEPPSSVPLPAAPVLGEATPLPSSTSVTLAVAELTPAPDTLAVLSKMLHELSGEQIDEAALDATFLDLAFDSLLLTQFRQELQQRFGVRVTARQLFEDLSTPRSLAQHLGAAAPLLSPSAPSLVAPVVAPAPAQESDPLRVLQRMLQDLSGSEIEGAALDATFLDLAFDSLLLTQFRQELQQRFGVRITARQLFEDLSTPRSLALHLRGSTPVQTPSITTSRSLVAPTKLVPQAAGPFQPLQRQSEEASLTPQQREHLRALTERLNIRHARSKAFAQKYRRRLADPRSVAGFRRLWKELTYQTVMERSLGSHVWDVDGHEYIDITMGFGANLLGHSPPSILEAVQRQLGQGYPIGPQTALAGEAADLICEMTGAERVTFCNTGSEAVMAAMRVARAVTGRDKIVYFNGDYHGNFDEVLLRPGPTRALPVAVGIPAALGDNVLVLEYGSPAALETLRMRAHEIAAVLVEPVQSRHPEVASIAFLHELRTFTSRTGSLLIFDEVITGFRAHPAGCQGYFGIEADLATYGKIVGGGFPIGVLAGKAAALDAIDGGAWQFGDDSFPEADMTFFAGTFVRHPLALAAGLAVLHQLKREGPNLQQRLNAMTETMLRDNNERLAAMDIPLRLNGFSSLFRFEPGPEFTGFPVLCFHLREAGIYIREPRQNCFLSTAHTQEDVERFSTALHASLAEMERGGWLTRHTGGAAPTKPAMQAASAPLTPAQAEVWIGCKLYPEQSRAFNESMWMRLRGPLDIAALRRAWREVLQRHEALRSTFEPQGQLQHFQAKLELDFPLADWTNLTPGEKEDELAKSMSAETEELFDLEHGPLARVRLGKLSDEDHLLFFTAHHLVCDGWSAAVLLEEFCQLYSGAGQPGPAPSYAQYAQRLHDQQGEAAGAEDEDYWKAQFACVPQPLELPLDWPRPAARSFAGAREDLLLPAELTQQLRDYAQRQRCTLHSVLYAAFQVLLARLSKQREFVIGLPVAGQSEAGLGSLVGHCVNLLPVRCQIAAGEDFTTLLARTRGLLLDAQEHASVTFGRLLQLINVPREANRVPLVSVIFNLDPTIGTLRLPGLEVQIGHAPRSGYQFDLGFNVIVEPEGLRVECDYSAELFQPETMHAWIGNYRELLEQVVSGESLGIILGEASEATVRPRGMPEGVDTHEESPAKETDAQRFSSTLEEDLGRIWAEILEHDEFGRDDDFFEVGGHSLLAMGMLYRVENELGFSIPIGQLFTTSTIAGLADFLQSGPAAPSARESLPLLSLTVVQAGVTGAVPLIYITGEHGDATDESYARLAQAIDPSRPFYLLRPRGWNGRAKPHQSKQMMVIDYAAEVRSLRPEGPYQLVGEGVGGLIAQELQSTLMPSGGANPNVTMINTQRPTESRLAKLAQSWAGRLLPGREESRSAGEAETSSSLATNFARVVTALPAATIVQGTKVLIDAETQVRLDNLGWNNTPSHDVQVHVLPDTTGKWWQQDLPALAAALRGGSAE